MQVYQYNVKITHQLSGSTSIEARDKKNQTGPDDIILNRKKNMNKTKINILKLKQQQKPNDMNNQNNYKKEWNHSQRINKK